MLLRTNELRCTRFCPAWFWAHCKALNRLADLGMARATKQSFPRMLLHLLALIRRRPCKLEKILCSACFQCRGSLRVWRAVSTIQPNISLRIPQLPSPVSSFFRDIASLHLLLAAGWDSTSSTLCSRCLHSARSLLPFPCPAWMKSSMKTSVEPTGQEKGLLESGARSCWL
jgi:hypothetical protein